LQRLRLIVLVDIHAPIIQRAIRHYLPEQVQSRERAADGEVADRCTTMKCSRFLSP
jgi:hypothetical protein